MCSRNTCYSKNKRGTWAAHSVSGFYVGPSTNQYRCYKIWVKDTMSIRTAQTVFFKHKYLTIPKLTIVDALVNAVKGTSTTLEGGMPQGCETKEPLVKLIEIFKTNAAKYKVDSAKSARKVLRDRASR